MAKQTKARRILFWIILQENKQTTNKQMKANKHEAQFTDTSNNRYTTDTSKQRIFCPKALAKRLNIVGQTFEVCFKQCLTVWPRHRTLLAMQNCYQWFWKTLTRFSACHKQNILDERCFAAWPTWPNSQTLLEKQNSNDWSTMFDWLKGHLFAIKNLHKEDTSLQL